MGAFAVTAHDCRPRIRNEGLDTTMRSLVVRQLLLVGTATAASYADGGDEMACWRQLLQVNCDTTYPGVALDVDWGSLADAGITKVENDPIVLNATLTWPASLNITQRANGYTIDHANLHACRTVAGFCSPFVSVQPQLVTHSTEIRTDVGNVTFNSQFGSADTWTTIVHYRLYYDGNIRADFAKGIIIQVKKREEANIADDTVRAFMVALVAAGIVAMSIAFLAVLYCRMTRLFKASSWRFIALSVMGGILGNTATFTFLPPFTHATCTMRVLLMPFAFDALFFPILLKTWRIKALLGASSEVQSKRITDERVATLLLLLLVADFVLCVMWVIVDGPVPTRVFSKISPHLYEIYCDGGNASPYFLAFVMTGKGMTIVWGLWLAWQVRAVVEVLNESSYIFLAILNLAFIAIFVVAMQECNAPLPPTAVRMQPNDPRVILLTAHRVPLTAHRAPLAARCSLLTARCSPRIVHCLLTVAQPLLSAVAHHGQPDPAHGPSRAGHFRIEQRHYRLPSRPQVLHPLLLRRSAA